MSTRAVYQFKESGKYGDAFVVYKHHDGYPSGAATVIQAARGLSWQGGRFEADEAAASFVAAAKLRDGSTLSDANRAGAVRLLHGKDFKQAPSDAAYFYVITQGKQDWEVECLSPTFGDKLTTKRLFKGELAAFVKWSKDHD